MKKEKILAAIIGAAAGLVLALVLLSYNHQDFSLKEKVKKEGLSSVPTVLPVKGIKIFYPEDKAILKDSDLELSFQVPENSLVVIVSPAFEKALFTEKRKVKVKIKLAFGENRIKIYAYPANPAFVNLEKEIVVYYLERKI